MKKRASREPWVWDEVTIPLALLAIVFALLIALIARPHLW